MITAGSNLQVVTEEQYYLSSKAGISLEESNMLPDFEREAYLNLVIRDMKTKTDNLKHASQQDKLLFGR